MRNPGFAASGVSPQAYLAGVIQGEASTPAGQFAVASVIYNRTESPTGGWGDNVLETASPYKQFNGYNPNYSENAYNLAGQTLNGTLDQSGSVGNAVNYANPSLISPSSSNYGWTQGLLNGGYNAGNEGNYFSDRAGAPSSNFEAPVYGGSTPTSTASATASNADALQDQAQDQEYLGSGGGNLPSFAQGEGGAAAPYYDGGNLGVDGSGPAFTQLGPQQFNSGSDTFQAPSNTFTGGTPSASIDPSYTPSQDASGSSVTADAGDYDPRAPDQADSGWQAAGDSAAPLTVTPYDQGGSGYTGNSFDGSVQYATPQAPDSGQASSSAGGSMTVPQAIDTQTQGMAADTTAQDKAISSAADSANKTAQSDTKALTGTFSGIASMFDAASKNLFVRGALILLGIIVVAFGLYSLAKDHNVIPKNVVPVPV